MSTSRMALRLIFLSLDLEPSVATSLGRQRFLKVKEGFQYHTVATPYFLDVSTRREGQ